MLRFLLVTLLAVPLAVQAQAPVRVSTEAPRAEDDVEDADRMGNFQIQHLMARFNQAETLNLDARPAMARVRSRDGLQRIAATRGGPTLFASVAGGAVVDYVAIDASGRVLGLQALNTTADGETICWKCAQGTDGNIHCWQIDCPVIAAPTTGDD